MKDFIKEIEEIRSQLDEMERKYTFIYDYKLISTILDYLGINDIKLTEKEVRNNKSYYIAERKEGTIHIRRMSR